MEVTYDILYHEQVVKKDIPALSSFFKSRIKRAIEEKLTTRPELFGKPLKHSSNGYQKLRVGDYRIIFRMEINTVMVLAIGHRSWIYKMMRKRLV